MKDEGLIYVMRYIVKEVIWHGYTEERLVMLSMKQTHEGRL